MNKVNHRKDIQKKEELRAKFQFCMAQNNTKVMGWLKPLEEQSATSQTLVNDSFFDLPIIASGSGLSSLDDEGSSKSVKKISDFVKSSDISKTMKVQTPSASRPGSSKAMVALMNKMRDSSRDKVVQNNKQNNKGRIHPQNVRAKIEAAAAEEDEDSDEEAGRNRSAKKARAKVGKRPF